MAPDPESRARTSLVRCPSCLSPLIYPVDLAGLEREIVVSRRCPECEHRDLVVAERLAALLWFDRYIRERSEIAGLCDALEDGLPVDLDIIGAQ
jgi:hypothetical protein